MYICNTVRDQPTQLIIKPKPSIVLRPPHVFNVHEKNWEGQVDFVDVMDMV